MRHVYYIKHNKMGLTNQILFPDLVHLILARFTPGPGINNLFGDTDGKANTVDTPLLPVILLKHVVLDKPESVSLPKSSVSHDPS